MTVSTVRSARRPAEPAQKGIRSKEDAVEEVKVFSQRDSRRSIHFSLSGSGEPTLHSQIRWIIEEIKRLSSVPVAVITNGSLLFRKEVREI